MLCLFSVVLLRHTSSSVFASFTPFKGGCFFWPILSPLLALVYISVALVSVSLVYMPKPCSLIPIFGCIIWVFRCLPLVHLVSVTLAFQLCPPPSHGRSVIMAAGYIIVTVTDHVSPIHSLDTHLQMSFLISLVNYSPNIHVINFFQVLYCYIIIYLCIFLLTAN